MTALAAAGGEVAKLGAFVRRDFLVMLSYRVVFVSELLALALQALLFSFIDKMIDTSALPSYGGVATGYLEFALIGVALSMATGLLLARVATAVRQEQMIGTFEALLVTPTAVGTLQAGSVLFDVLTVPLRIGILVVAVALGFGVHYELSGVLPSFAVLLMFLPFIWGLGLLAGAAMVTFRRGGGMLTAGVGALGLVSGAFFPLALLPDWLQPIAEANPIAITIESLRDTLIGGGGWAAIPPEAFLLLPMSIVALTAGAFAFRAALARERRRGTLGLY
jgi:ABC-2 type transport system permease protein